MFVYLCSKSLRDYNRVAACAICCYEEWKSCVNYLQEDQYLNAIHLGRKALTLACTGHVYGSCRHLNMIFCIHIWPVLCTATSGIVIHSGMRWSCSLFQPWRLGSGSIIAESWAVVHTIAWNIVTLPADNVGIGHSVMGGSFQHSGFSDRKLFSALGWSMRPALCHISEWTALIMHQTWHPSAKVLMGCPAAPPCIL